MEFVHLEFLALLGSVIGSFFLLKSQLAKATVDIKIDIAVVKTDISSIKERLARLEGAFQERGNWEPKVLNKKEEKK